MDALQVRQALRDGSLVFATAAIAPSSNWPRAYQRIGGIDFVFIDSEHTPLDRGTLSWMCQAFSAMGIPPVVRIPSPDPFEACKVLDGGASGFIAPYLETVDQIRQLIGVARYRPLKGARLRNALHDPNTLEPKLRSYLEQRNASTIFIANIESVPAIENLDDMLSIPGVDAVLIGPHDLSCSLGIPEEYEHPRFAEAAKTIFGKARARGCGAGLHWWQGVGSEANWIESGANLIMHSTDITLVVQHLQREIAELRSRFAAPQERPSSGTSESV
ncbi:MAG: aldolase [Planctomycetes bacterium]|nr:aldolase [Planctomycetota bacterium]